MQHDTPQRQVSGTMKADAGLLNILDAQPECRQIECVKTASGVATCDHCTCPSGHQCAAEIRHTLARWMKACLSQFPHEHHIMKDCLPDDVVELHRTAHGNLTHEVNEAISQFVNGTPYIQVISGINRLADLFHLHIDMMDAQSREARPTG